MTKISQLRISHESVIPLYVQLLNQLRQLILSGRWQADERVPSETELQQHLQISRSTIRQALGNAEVEGLIQRVPGRGTFVAHIRKQANTKPPLAFVVSDFNRPTQRDLLSGAESAARKSGYRVIFCNSHSDTEQEIQILNQLREDGVAGILLWSSVNDAPHYLAELSQNNFPHVVMMDRTFENVKLDYVASDNYGGGYTATQHLIELGHNSIAFLSCNTLDLLPIAERYRGYQGALSDAGYSPIKPWVIGKPNREVVSAYALKAYTAENNPLVREITTYLDKNVGKISAIFAINDNIALLALKAVSLAGLKVPDDISIVGYDDTEIASYLPTPLTTVAQNTFAIGEQAAELLIDRIEGWYSGMPKSVFIPTRLRVRASTTVEALTTFDKFR